MADYSSILGEIETTQALRDSALYRGLSDAVGDHSSYPSGLLGAGVPKEGGDKFRQALGAALGLDPERLNVRAALIDRSNQTLILDVNEKSGQRLLRMVVEVADDGGAKIAGVRAEPDVLLKHQVEISAAQLGDLVLPKAGPDHLLAPRTDPGLKHHVSTFVELSTNPRFKDSPYAETALQRGELAAFISRALYAMEQEPTPENISKAYTMVTQTQEAFSEVPLFEGRAVLSVAHGESVYEMTPQPELVSAGHTTIDYALRGQDDHRFGRARYQDSIKLLTGEKGSAEFLRPDREADFEVMRVRNSLQLNHEFFTAWNSGTLPEEIKPKLNESLAAALGEEDAAKLSYNYVPPMNIADAKTATGVLSVSVDGKKITDATLTFKPDGQLVSVRATGTKSDPEAYRAELKRVKELTFHKIANTEPGPNGFTFVFAGHGNADVVALSGGVPEQTPDGLRIRIPEEARISDEELAGAIIKRHEQHPADPSKPDIYVISACVSGDYVESVQKKLAEAGVPPVILLSQTEFNLLGFSEGINPIGNEFIEQILMPYEPDNPADGLDGRNEDIVALGHTKEPWNPAQVKKSPTLGDIIHAMQKDPLYPGSNPRVLAPIRSDQQGAEKLKWLQISGLERRGSSIA